MRRNLLSSVLLLAASVLIFGACGVSQTPVSNATSAGSNANTNAATGAGEGVGAHNAGIGGTSDNGGATVAGNSNVEPTGVNKNAGRPVGSTGNTASNSNR